MPTLSDDTIEIRKHLWEMFEGHSWHFLVTFAYNREKPISLFDARKLIGFWLQRMDRKVLGAQYLKKLSDRANLMGMFEHVDDNIHLHGLFLSPRRVPALSREEIETLGNRFWKKLIPSGDLDVRLITAQEGARKYLTKEVYNRGDQERLLVWTEFWSD